MLLRILPSIVSALVLSFVALLALVTAPVLAQSRILATPGAMQVEGAAGGGLVPWAVIGSYANEGEWGASAALTKVAVQDFSLTNAALLVGVNNRFELSYAHQTLRLGDTAAGELSAASAGAYPYLTVEQDVFGAKVRLAGDLIYGDLPQVSLGGQYKINHNADLATQVLGAESDSGTDIYVSASKLYLNALAGRNLLLNATVRYTDANQLGLLGFGGDKSAALVGEFSAALLFNRHWATGVEYRQKPNLLNSVEEDAWADAFVAWFPSQRFTLVAAYADLGNIALWDKQRGWYLSVQINH
ncbi:DUF3034 family protein [Simiduia curdlanivorans]|uniref:DUF3034 family protein n=1 Tax=Simiduia curdlanivorans TaxID=1492769 RepID=A0ABV8V1Z5_9GAMM|nr:DUF3034 family protein [Simiduia curdlanivorans]MDN3637821.1 DUF3034 family protein [Simiduia curdlanivorans]